MASTIPEQIVPSSLLAYTGDDFTTVTSVPLPNGDDSLLNTSAAASGSQRAFQARRLDSHLLRQNIAAGTDANAMSFWFRRRQSFTAFANLTTSTVGATGAAAPNGLIMGVGDPLATSMQAQDPALSWALWANNAERLQFGIKGFSFGVHAIYCSSSISTTLNTWHQIVVNIAPYTGVSANEPRGAMPEVWVDGRIVSFGNSTPTSNYFLQPRGIGNFDIARFAIGDPTSSNRAARGLADGPLFDLAKLVFHDRVLTAADQLAMLESMRYGP